MNTYLLLFVVALSASLALTPIVRRVCERLGWLDEPSDKRRTHRKAVPRLGGVAVFISILLSLSILPFINNLLTQALRGSRFNFITVLVPATLIFLFGIYDDLRGTGARLKFIVQGLAGLIFYLLGGHVNTLSIPFVGTVLLPQVLSCALTILWVTAISNAFNLIDGMDGLAGGAALFASLVMLVVSLMLGNPLVAVIAIAMCGALIGFLRYNFNPASIFLGDSGSLFVGFMLAALSVMGTQKASTAVAVAIPIIAFALPIIDTSFSMVRRFVGGRPLFEGDREHIHHKLLERGWSQRRAALVLYAVCATFGLIALLFINDVGMRTTGLVLFIIAAGVLFFGSRLHYHEVDEVRAGMKRNLGERRLRVANNIRVRRASRSMSEAKSVGDILAALQEMLELSEFVYASVRLGNGDVERCEEVMARDRGAHFMRRAKARGGLVSWAWERGDIEEAEIIGSDQFWSLRLPLSTERGGWGYVNLYRAFDSDHLLLDINYLCSLFQREMAEAVERVWSVGSESQPETAMPLAFSVSSGEY